MSILIPGISMPVGVTKVEIGYDADGYPMAMVGEDIYDVIPVPPHGRLINADALKQRAERGMDEHGRPCMLIKLGYVNTMPTIIPADPAEEGEG